MDVLVLIVLMYFATFGGSDAAWCVCSSDQSTPALQKTLDYACGAGADCTPILQTGPCYNPNTVVAHCSYAANSYYQRKGQDQGACDFSGTAALTSADPSGAGCTFPASPSAAGTSITTTTTTTTPTTASGSTTPAGSTPTTFTPTAGGGGTASTGSAGSTGGGIFGGLGPTGTTSIDSSGSDGGQLPPNPSTTFTFLISLTTTTTTTTFLSLSSLLF